MRDEFNFGTGIYYILYYYNIIYLKLIKPEGKNKNNPPTAFVLSYANNSFYNIIHLYPFNRLYCNNIRLRNAFILRGEKL